MSASYSTSKLVNPGTNKVKVKVKVKVVSSKVPRRPRFSQVGKSNKSTAITEVKLTTGPNRSEVLQQIKTNLDMAGPRTPAEETTATRTANCDTRPKRTGGLKAINTSHDVVGNRITRSQCKLHIDREMKRCAQTRVTSAKRETVPDSSIPEPPRDSCPRHRSRSIRNKKQPTHTLGFEVKKEPISPPRRLKKAVDLLVSPACGNRNPGTADKKIAIRNINFDTGPKRRVPKNTRQNIVAIPREPSPVRKSGNYHEIKRCTRTHVTSARIQQAVPDFRIAGHPENRRPRKAVDLAVSPPCGKRNPTREGHIACCAKRSLDLAKLASTKVPSGPFSRFFKDKVSLSQEDISRTSYTINNFISQILDKIREKDATFALKVLNTGSYYEHLKVSRPCEFDVMLVFDAHLIRRFFAITCPLRLGDPAVGYASLEFKKEVIGGRKIWGQFLTRDGRCLSPRKIVEYFCDLVEKSVAAMSVAQRRRISLHPPKLNGPAVTLTIDGKIDLDLVLSVEILEWPRCAKGWGDFATDKTWPTKQQIEQIKINNPKCHLVAKLCDAEERIDHDSHVYWRISFSEAEKALLWPKAAGSEKKYFRISKAMYEARKEYLKPLTSYHLKTLFLHCRRENPRAKSEDSNLGESVVNFFTRLIDRLKGGRLPHFFVDRVDLLSRMSQEKRSRLAKRLEYFLHKLVENPETFLGGLTLS